MSDTGLIFGKAVLYIDPDDTNIEIGEAQDVSVEFRDTTVKARGKGLYPLAVRLADREATLRCSWLQVMAQGLYNILGGSVIYADDETTLAIVKTTEPSTFKMKLMNPTDGSEAQMILYKVRPINFSLPMSLKDFSIPNAEFEIMVDDDDKVCDIILPGYQSTQ